jgi:hypothetical protein
VQLLDHALAGHIAQLHDPVHARELAAPELVPVRGVQEEIREIRHNGL